MKSFIYIVAIGCIFLQSCTSTRRFGTTIERDENNPCQINMVIQVAIQGTADDIKKVRAELEYCFNKECFIPCPDDSLKGCKTKITVVVKGYGELKQDELSAFHYVEMVDNDGLPSNAYIGTPNHGTVSGTWRRDEPYGTYCHEVLHFCGLSDKYCSRLFDPVTGAIKTERVCVPPPEPFGNCCVPHAAHTRCSTPCAGHEHNIMGASGVGVSCDNIKDVLKGAGLNSCPPECCASDKTFTKPPDETYILPGYLHYGDKFSKFGSLGTSVGGTIYIGPKLGLTLEGGMYRHTKEENNFEQKSEMLNLEGGIRYQIDDITDRKGDIGISSHLLIGMSRLKDEITSGSNTDTNSETSLKLSIGASLNKPINRSFMWRVLQVDYSSTFFNDETQHNYRLSTGLVYLFRK